MDLQPSGENSRLRASDADRDRAASVLNYAMAEGRLTAEEHSERLDAIYAARTQADLVPLLDDLPATGSAGTAAPSTARPAARRAHQIIAILGGASRKGAWHPDSVINIVTVMGGVELDFRGAVLPGREIRIRMVCVMGGLSITVPPEMRVVDSVVPILGGIESAGDSEESLAPDAPVLHISGLCLMGGAEIKRKPRKEGQGRPRGLRA